jgi:hypothetical protein
LTVWSTTAAWVSVLVLRSFAAPSDPGPRRPVRRPFDQHVLGFEVAMDDSRGVHRGQTGGDAGHDLSGLPLRAGHRHRSAEVAVLDEIHHDRQLVALGDQITDPDDVRVVDALEQPALLQEPLDQVGIASEVVPEHFHGTEVTSPAAPAPERGSTLAR